MQQYCQLSSHGNYRSLLGIFSFFADFLLWFTLPGVPAVATPENNLLRDSLGIDTGLRSSEYRSTRSAFPHPSPAGAKRKNVAIVARRLFEADDMAGTWTQLITKVGRSPDGLS